MLKVFAFVCLIASASATFWRACPAGTHGHSRPPNNIISPACDEVAGRCTIARDETLHADVYITPGFAHANLWVTVTAFIFGIPVNLPQVHPHDNACNSIYWLDGRFKGCPTTPELEVIYKIEMVIPSTYPAFSNTIVRFELSEHDVVEGCVEVIATLT